MSSEYDLLHEFRNEASRQEQVVENASVPVGWQPYSEYSDQIGEAIVRLPSPGATEKDLLTSAGFDPASWKIHGPISTRRWMRFDQEWLYYYKFDVVAGESEEVVEEHIDELVKKIRKGGPTVKTQPTDDDAFVVFASDWQIGKASEGIGTSETIDRIVECFDKSALRVKELRKTGRSISHGSLIGMGDIVEGCLGNYSTQLFTVDRPAADPGSKWYRDSTGEDSPPGMLTIRLSKDEMMGYSDLQVLRPSL